MVQHALRRVLDEAIPEAETLTYEQFLDRYGEDDRVEWVKGKVIEQMAANLQHQRVEELLLTIVGRFVRLHQLGLAIHEFSMKLPETGRVPDFLFTRNQPADEFATHLVGPADLAVEIVSPDSIERDLDEKPAEYAEGGVGEYWIADLVERKPHFLQRNDAGELVEVFPDADGWYESRVLPGLRFPARWLVEPPDPDWAGEQLELSFTPERFEAERARADAEQARADAEQARADAEQARADAVQARADRLAARLRALNIDPDLQ